ncbi:MAG TPA: flagellar export protein FliJ [Thermodesulfobacteriota bacterium]
MPKFTFKLEPLFEYRQRLEELSQKEFGEALSRLKSEEEKIGRLKELYMKSSSEIDALKESGAPGAEMDLYHSYVAGLKRHISEQERILSQVSAAVEKKRVELVEASKNKKVIELMKEKSLHQHNQRVNRQEQKESDERNSRDFGRKDADER